MEFDLSNLIRPHSNIEHLCLLFSREEIDNIILNLPSDKAPRPDGFSNSFLKKVWHIIRDDCYTLSEDFFFHKDDLKSVNHSSSTLIPKKDNPEIANDFRPISLVNSSPKLVSKIMANRLQTVALEVVYENQYGFIKGRTLQDCLGWAFEYLQQCHHSKRPIIILKLDFEKAFDLVEHSVVIAMLRAKGFLDRWIKWVQDLFCSATSSVLLNQTVGNDFPCKRGVRQGDPLSPLLFAIAANLLESVINHEYAQGTLIPPFPQNPSTPFTIVQYANDTILVMKACESQLLIFKDILHKVTLSSGLKVNFHKSCLVPINIDHDHASLLANTFGCVVGSFHFTYLGLPMGLTKSKVKDYAPLICRIEKKLSASSQFSLMLEDCSSSTLLSPPSPFTSCALSNYRPLSLKSLTNIEATVCAEVKSLVIRATTLLPGIWFENQKIKVSLESSIPVFKMTLSC
jgi:hypothetical protein